LAEFCAPSHSSSSLILFSQRTPSTSVMAAVFYSVVLLPHQLSPVWRKHNQY
jgi:hypothetical protein